VKRRARQPGPERKASRADDGGGGDRDSSVERGGDDRDEAAFLATYDPNAFDAVAVTVDVVLLGIIEGALCVLLLDRPEHPAKGRLALPGGFVRAGESLDAAAARVLADKAGLERIFLEQLYTFGAPKRDPRMRVISVAYYALVESRRFARSIAYAKTAPLRIDALAGQRLAFDHAEIVATAVTRIRGKLTYAPIGYELLPSEFTLLDLQRVHECVAGRTINKDSFRRKMLATGLLEATGAMQENVGHRPAALYRYVRSSVMPAPANP
jgi:8-oxo-dGTP diphosphatase